MNSKHRKQAAEKRKREEALLNTSAFPKPFDTVEELIDALRDDKPPRIWIGTGDAGEPNEQ